MAATSASRADSFFSPGVGTAAAMSVDLSAFAPLVAQTKATWPALVVAELGRAACPPGVSRAAGSLRERPCGPAPRAHFCPAPGWGALTHSLSVSWLAGRLARGGARSVEGSGPSWRSAALGAAALSSLGPALISWALGTACGGGVPECGGSTCAALATHCAPASMLRRGYSRSVSGSQTRANRGSRRLRRTESRTSKSGTRKNRTRNPEPILLFWYYR